MPLYIKAGTSSLLRVGTSLASGSACCCATGGACCTAAYGCIGGVTEAECTDVLNGVYKGNGTSANCLNPEYCECTLTGTVTCCLGGTWRVAGMKACDCKYLGGASIPPSSPPETCNEAYCGAIGSCCFPDGDCNDDLDICTCEALGGSFSSTTACAGRSCVDRTGSGLLDSDCVICSIIHNGISQDGGLVTCLNSSSCNSNPGRNCSDTPADIYCAALSTWGWNAGFAPCAGTPNCVDCDGYRCILPGIVSCMQRTRSSGQMITTWGYCKLLRDYDINWNQVSDIQCGASFPHVFISHVDTTTTSGVKVCTSNCGPVTLVSGQSVRVTSCSGPCSGSYIFSSVGPTTTMESCTGCGSCP